jgi:ribosomal protein L19E
MNRTRNAQEIEKNVYKVLYEYLKGGSPSKT